MGTDDTRVCLAAIAGSYGVRGEVRLKCFTADPAAVADYGALQSEDGAQRWQITLGKPVKGGYAAKLSGLRSKEAADALRGTRLYADRTALPDLPDDEFYHADLIGLSVRDTGGETLGRVKAVLNHGAADLLEVALKEQPGTALVPFTAAIVPTVDISAGVIIVDPPDGLFSDG